MGFGGRLESLWEGHRFLTVTDACGQSLDPLDLYRAYGHQHQAHHGIPAIIFTAAVDCIAYIRLMTFVIPIHRDDLTEAPCVARRLG